MLNIKLSVAQNESDQTSDRIKYINEGKIRRHEVLTGKHSFGYCIKDKHYAIVPEEAEIVRFIYDRALAGDSCNRITHLIYDKWGRAMSIRHARCILLNDVYIGTYHGIEDYHDPIIDKTTNERVKALLRAHRRPTRSDYVYLFTGKMVCPSCGGVLVAHRFVTKKHGRTALYYCSRRNVSGVMVGPDACQFGGGVRETVVEHWLMTHLGSLLHSSAKEKDHRRQALPIERALYRWSCRENGVHAARSAISERDGLAGSADPTRKPTVSYCA